MDIITLLIIQMILTQNVYESNYQDELKSTYQTSWAVGFGAAYWGKSLSVHISAEWYDAVKKYNQ